MKIINNTSLNYLTIGSIIDDILSNTKGTTHFYENHKKLGLTISGHNHKLAEYETEDGTRVIASDLLDAINGWYFSLPVFLDQYPTDSSLHTSVDFFMNFHL